MGLYINSGSELFEEARRGNIYVDKSGIINYINSVIRTNNKYICVSRPRRFGKTMGINMLLAYYGVNNNADNLFKDLKAETNNKYANSFFTVKINGVTIGNVAVKANDSDGVLIGAINAKKDETGVEASVENGRLVLAAKDGRAIIVDTHSVGTFTIAGAKPSNWSVQGIA